MSFRVPITLTALSLSCCLMSSLLAVPVAVNDSFTVAEDNVLATASQVLFTGDFEPATSYVSGNWEFLDKIQNELGSPASQTYPLDGAGRDWKSVNYNTATSTIGPWGSNPMPIQYGGIDGLPGAPSVISASAVTPGSGNKVTTFLFRNVFTLTASEAAMTTFSMPYIADDGMVVYLNGTEVARLNMPTGTIDTNTVSLNGGSGPETTTDYTLTIPSGILTAGQNVMAVELHQNAVTSSDIGLNIALSAPVSDGFAGSVKTFGTNGNGSFQSQGTIESFAFSPTDGVSGGGALTVDVGYRPLGGPPMTPNARSASAGWSRTFNLGAPATVNVAFSHRMLLSTLASTEYGEVILDIDGTKYGNVPANSTAYPAGWKIIARSVGNAGTVDSGWLNYTGDIALGAGSHTIKLGVFNNTTNGGTRHVQGYFDNVVVTIPGGGAGVLANDTGGAVAAVLQTGPTKGAVTLNLDGTFSYSPNLNATGADTFTYKARDATNVLSNTAATVTINITPVNDAPVAVTDTYSATEDTLLTVNAATGLLANDTDVEADALTAIVDVQPAHGTLTLNANGSFTYQPELNYTGADSFSYHAADATLSSNVATVTINITAVNDAPVAVADSYNVSKNGVLSILDPNGSSVTEEIISGAARDDANNITTPGSIWKYLAQSSAVTGAWTTAGFDDSAWPSGASELGFGDNQDNPPWPEATVISASGFATVYFRKAINITDIASVTALSMQVMRDDGVIVYINGTPAYRNNLSASPAYATLATNTTTEHDFQDAAVLGTTGQTTNWLNVAPTPALFVEGNNIFAAEVHQSSLSSTDLSFDLKCSITKTVNRSLLKNDIDAENNALTAVLVTGPSHGTLTLNSDGTFTYTPTTNYLGTDSFTYRANDGTAQSNIATVTLNVINAANTKPTAVNDTYAATEDTTLTVPVGTGVVSNDVDPDADQLSAILVSNVTHGTLTLNSNGSFTYLPAANYNGPDSFTYSVQDTSNNFSTNLGTVTINVASVNDAPVAVNDSYATEPSVTLNIAAPGVLTNDTDVDSAAAALSAQIVTSPSSGTLTLNSNGSFSYVPAANGVFTFTYRTSDGSALSAPATVSIAVNAAPIAGGNSYTTAEETLLSINAPGLLANDSDPEGSTLTAVKLTDPSHGAVTVNSNGSFIYVPATNFAGSDSFTYAANDGIRNSPPATVVITVTNVNDAPVAVADSYMAMPNQTLTVAAAQGVLSNDSDPDSGAALASSLVQTTLHGILSLNADGSFTYLPTTDYIGTDTFTYTVSDGILTSPATTVSITVAAGSTDIVINEILFRPGTTFPENPLREYVELYNRGTTSVNIGGWQFTSGISYTIPAGRVLAPNSYLVVASNVAAFQANFPAVTNVIGGWTGTLSNSAEKIELSNALGVVQDEVTYASEGDWAQRIRETTFNGWDWSPATKGNGMSLELRNPNVSNDNGQNWQPSAVAGGTPGAVNAAFTTNVAPIIHGVKHSPAVPKSTDTVVISCELNDELAFTALTATVYYRNATTTSPGPFTPLPMSSDGNGGWFAPIPALPNLSIVEFYVSASDGTLTRTWPAPTSEGQNANCQYQVDNETPSTTADMYRMVLTATENAAFNTVSTSSDRQFNQTLIITRGTENTIRYRADMRIRGNSSRTYQFKPLRLHVPVDDDLDGVSSFNCNPKASYLQFFGMRLFQAAGMRATDAIPIELRRNGVESSTSSGSTPDFGMWVRVEDVGGEMVDSKWPLTNGGGVYKKGRNDYYWRSSQAAPSNPDSVLDGWTKQNASAANDWSDLRSFFSVWMAACAPHFPGSAANDVAASGGAQLTGNGTWNSTIFSAAEVANLETVSDFDQWARWFALMTILQDNETNISNGQDDDYAVYFEPKVINGTPRIRMQLIPHDLDTIFGLGDNALVYNDRGLFDMTENSYVFRPLLPLFGTSTVTGYTDFRTKYFDALRELLGTIFNTDTTANPNPPFNVMIDNELGNWAPAATRTTIKTFMNNRRTYLLGLMAASATTPPAGTSNATVTAAHGNLMLHEILANNTSAHSNGGLFPDVIELRNSGATSINLSGMSLTDNPTLKTQFVFPSGTTLAAGGIMIVYADSATAAPGLHTGFGLNADGDAVYLYDTVANGQALLDSISFGIQPANLSIGRTGAGLDTWGLCTPTINLANTAVATLASPANIRINEWLGNADYLASNDFIEIYNPGSSPVAIGGMVMTDDLPNYPARGTIPQLSFLPAGGFYAFETKGSSASAGNAKELPFNLNSTYGSVWFLGANGSVVDRVETISQFRDGSSGRLPDGGTSISTLPVPSPGATNATLTANDQNLLNYLRITEMMYAPTGNSRSEYIELRNMSDKTGTPVTLDLGGVYFSSGITYTFPTTTLAAGAHFVLVGEPAKFTTQFPAVTINGTITSGKLDNSGETVRLNIPSGNAAILDFKYSDSWYPSTGGGGDALQIVDGTQARALWDKKQGWQAGTPSPGSSPAFSVYAGADLITPPSVPLYLDGTIVAGAVLPQNISVAWTQESGPGTVTFTTGDYQDANGIFSAPGVYVLRFTANASSPVSTVSDTTTVTVTEPYEAWAADNITGPFSGQQGKNQDPDGDGVQNLIEYATGGNPIVPDVAFTFVNANGTLTMNYNRSKLVDPSLKLIPQFSLNLTNWSDETTGIDVFKTMPSETQLMQSWSATYIPGGTRVFGRLKVEMP